MEKRKGKQKGGRPPKRPGKKTEVFDFAALPWDTIKRSRQSLTSILTAFATGEVAEGKLRVMIYGSRALLAFLEAERGLDLDARLDRLEKRVEEILAQKGGVHAA
jgi:hypothetical protein